jgi:5-methylcytosine-specific restriction endonuclease McrA
MSMEKRARLRLDSAAYDELKREILERDGWRCQHCGRRERLEIHHLIRRSQSGADCEDNLILLCNRCHHSIHLSSATGVALGQTEERVDNDD